VLLNEQAYVQRTLVAIRRLVSNTSRMQIGTIITMIVVLWVSIGVHLLQIRDEAIHDAVQESRNLAYAAEQSVEGMIAGVDQMLLFIRAAHAADPAHFDLDGLITNVRSVRGDFLVGIIDQNGMLQPNRRNALSSPIDLSDRSHYRFHLNNPGDVLFISEPLKLRASGKWSVQFSRKMTATDGSFAGTVVLSLDPSWLTRLYATLDIGEGSLMVTGTDGIVRARASRLGLGMGGNLASPNLQLISAATASDQGSFRSVSPLDGVERFMSFQRLPDYPLIVSVGLDAGEVFAPYFNERKIYLIVGAVATILILITGGLLSNQSWRLLRSRQVLLDAVEYIDQGLMMIDENRDLPLINRRAIELLSIPPEVLAHTPSYDRLLQWQLDSAEFGTGTEDEKRFRAHGQLRRFDLQDACYERVRPDGRVLEIRTQVLPNGGAVRTYSDITERKRAEERILRLVHHDGLTGLPNRTLLNDRLSQAINLSARDGGTFAILALNLDRFKAMNDRFGRAAGDRLLMMAAERIEGALSGSDTLARVGGDEFVVLQIDAGQPTAAAELSHRLIGLLSEPFDTPGEPGSGAGNGASIGIAVYPVDGESAAALLKNAHTGLDRAKAHRRGSFCFFEAQMDSRLRERWSLEHDLRLAIGTKQLRLHYQPVFASATRSITGFEALLRWQHPVRGDIPPMVFVPIAEETGMILAIGTWVLEEACRFAATWAEPKRVAVNLSAAQLHGGGLPAEILCILRRTGLSAQRLELEVTETMLITDHHQALATLQELRDMGVHIACDDFGTGYSSFSYLENLAFDRIKIDKSFVKKLGVTESAQRIVQAILAMARSLDLEVTAEGVETEEQFSILKELDCGEIQGYLLGRPMQPEATVASMRTGVTV
jgi:diguanylate cyclase (GGDEF)-like protein